MGEVMDGEDGNQSPVERMLKKMGSLRDVMEKLPFFSDAMADGVKFDDKQLVVIESMKMEMRIVAQHAGIARGLGYAVGDSVERGAVLVKVETGETRA